MFKSVDLSKLYSLLALLLFVAAVFTITDGKFLLGVVLIGAGACFSSVCFLRTGCLFQRVLQAVRKHIVQTVCFYGSIH